MEKNFPNGFESWQATHYQVVSEITSILARNFSTKVIDARLKSQGTGGLWVLAEELTDQFEEENKDNDWIDQDYFDELQIFLNKNLHGKK